MFWQSIARENTNIILYFLIYWTGKTELKAPDVDSAFVEYLKSENM